MKQLLLIATLAALTLTACGQEQKSAAPVAAAAPTVAAAPTPAPTPVTATDAAAPADLKK